MPTSASDPQALVDTSAAVALSVADHEGRPAVLEAVRGKRIGLAGHAAFETFSVLTRLPGAARRPPAVVSRMLATNFPHTRHLDVRAAATLLARFADLDIAGGAVYDALVGQAAVECGVPLVTRDRRAVATYRAFEVEVVFVR